MWGEMKPMFADRSTPSPPLELTPPSVNVVKPKQIPPQ